MYHVFKIEVLNFISRSTSVCYTFRQQINFLGLSKSSTCPHNKKWNACSTGIKTCNHCNILTTLTFSKFYHFSSSLSVYRYSGLLLKQNTLLSALYIACSSSMNPKTANSLILQNVQTSLLFSTTAFTLELLSGVLSDDGEFLSIKLLEMSLTDKLSVLFKRTPISYFS